MSRGLLTGALIEARASPEAINAAVAASTAAMTASDWSATASTPFAAA
jgi:hypothetical protein